MVEQRRKKRLRREEPSLKSKKNLLIWVEIHLLWKETHLMWEKKASSKQKGASLMEEEPPMGEEPPKGAGALQTSFDLAEHFS